jgi:D-3-phosphoglycerate dehydrogenase
MFSNRIVVVAEKPFSVVATDEMAVICQDRYQLLLIQGYKDREQEVFPFLGDAVAVVVRSDKVDEAFLNATSSQLKVIGRAGTGYDTIDINLCKQRGVAVLNTPGQNSNAVAELVFGLILHVMRRGFSGRIGTELKGKMMGLHGFGAIAKIVAKIAKNGFGMNVSAYDPYVDDVFFQNLGVHRCSSLDELYSTCQIISIHIPLNTETKACIGLKLMDRLLPNTVLVNTARAEVIDDVALQTLLDVRRDVLYCADVVPKNITQCLETAIGEGRVFFTQVKCGAQTEEANTNCGLAAIHEIIDFLESDNTAFQVNY